MKRNIYSKLWVIFFVLMGAACTNQVEDAIPVSGQPIEFAVQSDWKEIPNTRSNPGRTEFYKNDTIQIFGFHRSSNGENEKKFMYRVGEPDRGQIVVFNGTNWNYSPKRFWPKEGKLDFYAGYPHYSVLNDETNHLMTYEQPLFNPLGLDLLWGVSNNHDCTEDRKNNVSITMKHALARVNIIFDQSLGNIGTVIVSAYKAGRFTETDGDGIPNWIFNDDDKKNIDATFNYKDLKDNDTVTVFILPDKITGLRMFDYGGNPIDASDKIKSHTFKAGKVYNLKISKGVQKNTNTRSIAMSVRCVSK